MQHVANWPTRTKWRPALLLRLVIGLMLLSTLGRAQSSSVQWSPTITIPKSEDPLKITLVDNDQPVIITQFGESLILRPFEEGASDRPVFLRASTTSRLVNQEVTLDRLTILEQPGETEEGMYRVAQSVLHTDQANELFSYEFKLSRKAKAGFQNKALLAVSDDGNQVAVCQQEAFIKATKTEFNVLLADENGSKSFHLPSEYDSDDVELLGATIDTAGIVYLGVIAGVKLNSPFRKRYLIYSFNPSDSVLTEFDLISSDLFIRDVVIRTTPQGLKIAALYNADPLEDKKTYGFTYVKLTRDGKEIEQRVVSGFDQSMIRLHEGSEAVEGDLVSNLHVYDILDLGGRPVLAVERSYQDQICTADPRTGMLNCTDQFHYDGISLIDVLQQKTVLNIPKRQLDYDRKSPYSFHISTALPGGNQLILYNDHFKNEGLSTDKVMNNPNRSNIRYVRIHTNGKYTAGFLLGDRQDGLVFTPLYGISTSESRAFFLSISNRDMSIGSIDAGEL